MSTYARASKVIEYPVERVWEVLRDFSFPAKVFATIVKCKILNNDKSTTVGAVRELTWKTGEKRSHKLVSLNDRFFKLSYELIASSDEYESTAAITSIELKRVTEGNFTLVSWATEFGSNTKSELISFEKKAYIQNISDIETYIKNSVNKKKRKRTGVSPKARKRARC